MKHFLILYILLNHLQIHASVKSVGERMFNLLKL